MELVRSIERILSSSPHSLSKFRRTHSKPILQVKEMNLRSWCLLKSRHLILQPESIQNVEYNCRKNKWVVEKVGEEIENRRRNKVKEKGSARRKGSGSGRVRSSMRRAETSAPRHLPPSKIQSNPQVAAHILPCFSHAVCVLYSIYSTDLKLRCFFFFIYEKKTQRFAVSRKDS